VEQSKIGRGFKEPTYWIPIVVTTLHCAHVVSLKEFQYLNASRHTRKHGYECLEFTDDNKSTYVMIHPPVNRHYSDIS
jgi:hypothetical protein